MSLAGGSQTGRGVWPDPKIVESHIAPRQKHFITSVTLDRCLARSKTQTYQSCHIISYQILFYHNLSNIIMISYHADCGQIQKPFWQAPKLRLLASKVFLPGAIGSSYPKYPGDFSWENMKSFSCCRIGFLAARSHWGEVCSVEIFL